LFVYANEDNDVAHEGRSINARKLSLIVSTLARTGSCILQ
jgi:hypothetical protein